MVGSSNIYYIPRVPVVFEGRHPYSTGNQARVPTAGTRVTQYPCCTLDVTGRLVLDSCIPSRPPSHSLLLPSLGHSLLQHGGKLPYPQPSLLGAAFGVSSNSSLNADDEHLAPGSTQNLLQRLVHTLCGIEVTISTSICE